ncbi:MAG: ABC transporter substrate-binding protein [Spirochaetaceae bacterium]|jgi:raffinose/stachyose/melibiose transport system substrate-binding protein|nr:ABC transporter substrate-binding protein [Spirochaetaceae bacterium]
MKKTAYLLSVLAVLCIGCSKAGSGSSAGKSADKGYDLYVFNAKGENAAQFEAMAQAFQGETGIRVKTFSIGAGADQSAPMLAEMNSKNPPAIYSIQGINNLAQWLEGGYVVDLSTAPDPDFAKLVADIAPNLRMSLGGNTSYGIPYNIEGYGFIADRQMLADIFGVPNPDEIIADIKTASYPEWEAFVTALDAWIQNPQSAAVTLSGKSHALAGAKQGLAANLTGVGVIMGSETWTYGGHYVNVALNAVFPSQSDALNPTPDQLRNLRNPLIGYAKGLELKTRYLAGKNGKAQRGQDLVSPANFGYDQAVQIFAEGKAVFLKQGNWAYNNIANVNKAMAERLTFLPIKMPFTQSDIVSGLTAEKINRSIPIFVPNYYAVNALSSEEEKQAAYKFLVWMNTSKTGQKFIIEDMAFIPYNADPASTVVPNSLGNSIIAYMKDGDMLNGLFLAVPGTWPSDTLGKFVMERYLTKPEWSEADFAVIADYGVDQWLQLLKQ